MLGVPSKVIIPKVSVIVPVWNVEGHIGACIASIQAQIWPHFEVIVINDGSTDKSLEVIQRTIGDDLRFKIVSQKNSGLSAARNAGLDIARGQAIAFIDGDDRIAPDFLLRLWSALQDTQADWVSCGIRFCETANTSVHSSIHGAVDPNLHTPLKRWEMTDWVEIIRHFPSAWNKLYRRDLIEGLRFDEGTWFEDHMFYCRVAQRTDHLIHIPTPLYYQTRGRQGQITSTDSDRVFEQFDVLEQMRNLMKSEGKINSNKAFQRISSRLVFERTTALRCPTRRTRFAAKSAAFFHTHGLCFASEWDHDISLAWDQEMQGDLPLSVVVPFRENAEQLKVTLRSLERQPAPGREILIVCGRHKDVDLATTIAQSHPEVRVLQHIPNGIGAARNLGLAAARGQFVVFADIGDVFTEGALHHWCDTMLRHRADFGLSAFGEGIGTGHVHSGFHDQSTASTDLVTGKVELLPHIILNIHARLSAKIFRRSFLIDNNITFGKGLLSEWPAVLLASIKAQKSVYFASPGVEVQMFDRPHKPLSPRLLLRAHQSLINDLSKLPEATLPDGWKRKLFARAIRENWISGQDSSHAAKATFLLAAILFAFARGYGRNYGPNSTTLDPSIGPKFKRLLNPRKALVASLKSIWVRAWGQKNAVWCAPLQNMETSQMLTFPVQKDAKFQYQVDFSKTAFANISFFDTQGENILFHLSLRLKEGIAVCNRRVGSERWHREWIRPLTSRARLQNVEIAFTPPEFQVYVEGQLLFSHKPGLVQNRFGSLDNIQQVDFQGGIVPASIHMDIGTGAVVGKYGFDGILRLNNRLELRANMPLSSTGNGTDFELDIPGVFPLPKLIGQKKTHNGCQGVVLRSVLPGRIWQDVSAATGIRVRLLNKGNHVSSSTLYLHRDTLAACIDKILTSADFENDPLLAMQIVEHVRFGNLYELLGRDSKNELANIIDTYRLGKFIEVSTGKSTTSPSRKEETKTQRVSRLPQDIALSQFAQTMRQAPHADPLVLLASFILSMAEAKNLYLALSEYFCRPEQNFRKFFAMADKLGVSHFESTEDAWENSAMLPFLFLEGRAEDVRSMLWALVKPTETWIVTPAIAWVMRQVTHRPALDTAFREDVLYAFIEFVAARAPHYWERAQCQELCATTVEILDNRHSFADWTQPRIYEFAIQSYGLSSQFWQKADAKFGRNIPQELITARSAFKKIADFAKGKQYIKEQDVENALVFFEKAGNSEVGRIRCELFGPLGHADLQNTNTHITNEAAVRFLCFPGAPEGNARLARSTAAALPVLYDEVPRAPHYQTQIRASRRIADILNAPTCASGVTLDTINLVMADIAVLVGESSGRIGLSLGIGLVTGLARNGNLTDAETVLCRLELLVDEANIGGTSELALAILMSLYTLRHTSCGDRALSRLCTRVFALFPTAEAALQEMQIAGTPRKNKTSVLFDTIITVFSCKPNLKDRIPALRQGWVGMLQALGIPYVIIVGGGDGSRVDDVVHVDAPDDYEGLPQKALSTIRWVHDTTNFTYMLKIDDDCFLNADEFFHSHSYRKFDYYGRILTRQSGQTDRSWHTGKASSDRGKYELDKSPEPSTYADGGCGYALSRRAMAAVLTASSSVAGQHLVQVSFMEDKMVGDLLSMRGVSPADEDYRISVRRRMHSRAIPVSRWVNGFNASKAAPTKLVHLDDTEAQFQAHKSLTTNTLTPKKIWPSFQSVTLGYQSNALEMVSPQTRLDNACAAPLAVVACVRNEMFMLPHFLAHYRRLGVSAFLIADNCSDDGTLEYLADQPDVALFSVDTDYNRSYYGVAWQQALIANFRVGKWSLMADADEHLIWETKDQGLLADVLTSSEFAETDAVRLFMLDMYPQGNLAKATFSSGDLFKEAGYVDHDPFMTDWPGQGPYSNAPVWTSALRHRLIPGARRDLFVAQKIALLKYRPWMRLSAGLHFASDVQLAKRELLFAHFKYNADFYRKAQAEVTRRQHFNDAEEYQKYLALLSEGRDIIFENGVSVPWAKSPFVRNLLAKPKVIKGPCRPAAAQICAAQPRSVSKQFSSSLAG